MPRTALSVNLNKIALLRNQRAVGYPDVVAMGRIALRAGAQGLTVHPRPDERHVRRHDVFEISALVRSEFDASAEFNVEGYPSEPFLALVEEVRPDQVTLVPDSPEQATSDHGWPLPESVGFLAPVVARLKAAGMRVSLFVDDDPDAARAAAGTGADRLELYTGPYHEAYERGEGQASLRRFASTAAAAAGAGLGLNAGHDLNLSNLAAFLAAVPEVREVSIGHALTSDALEMGMDAAVRAYLAEIARAAG